MTRRSALTIAGGVAAAMLAGIAALSINLGIMQASGDTTPPPQKPIVKTVVKTVHVKPKAKKQQPVPVKTVVVRTGGSSSTGGSGGNSGSGSYHENEQEHEHEFGESDDD
jgi:hypothetical protein